MSGSIEYVLYRNPDFKGVATAALESGDVTAVPLSFDTANRRTLILPAGVMSISIAESYNAGWKYSLDGEKWLPVTENEIRGMTINLSEATNKDDTWIKMRYRPAYQAYYRPTIIACAVCLTFFSIIRKTRKAKRLAD